MHFVHKNIMLHHMDEKECPSMFRCTPSCLYPHDPGNALNASSFLLQVIKMQIKILVTFYLILIS